MQVLLLYNHKCPKKMGLHFHGVKFLRFHLQMMLFIPASIREISIKLIILSMAKSLQLIALPTVVNLSYAMSLPKRVTPSAVGAKLLQPCLQKM